MSAGCPGHGVGAVNADRGRLSSRTGMDTSSSQVIAWTGGMDDVVVTRR